MLNHTYNAAIKSMHINASTSSACNISPLLRFHFWQPPCFKANNSVFPNNTNELRGRLVGASENAGHDMTFCIFNSAANKPINHSIVRPAGNAATPNLRADPLNSPEIIKSLHK